MNLFQALLDGIIIGTIFNAGIFYLMRLMPRGILHMLPPRFRAGAPAQPRAEIARFYKLYLPQLAFLAFVMAVNGVRVYRGMQVGFWDLFWHGYIVALFMNFGDAFLLDLLEIHTNRAFYADAFGIEEERLRAGNFFRKVTFREHFLLWPLIICPIIGCLFAIVVGSLI